MTSLPYRVVPMEVGDLDNVMRIERQSHTASWSISAYRHELEENRLAHYLVLLPDPVIGPVPPAGWAERLMAWLGGQRHDRPLLGYGGFWLMVDEAHISTIAVDPEWRGLGLGELVLIHLIEKALSLGATMVTLEVRLSNEVAQRLYEKYGFEIVGQRRRYYRDNNEDAHIMTVEQVQEPQFRELLDRRWEALRQRLTAPHSTGGTHG